MNIDVAKKMLERLRDEIEQSTGKVLTMTQQTVARKNMCFKGGNGRIWIQPTNDYWDVSLSGQSVEAELTPVFQKLFGRVNDGFKQTRPILMQPFWRTTDFRQVKEAALLFPKHN